MKTGENLNGYILTQPFSNVGGGQSEWTFARKSGNDFFLKRFLKPTYPVEGGPGSPRIKEERRARCARFEDHHRTIQRLLQPLSKSGGNLVVTRDFFRVGAHYFKATDKVDTATLSLQQISRLPLDEKISLMITVCGSVRILHRESLVHGDLKPDNVLVSRGASRSAYATKLIDFDNCFQSASPPAADDLVGDPTYYSPEMMFYISDGTSDARSVITQASDVFALALMFSQYLTGKLPTGRSRYLADSLLQGHGLALPPAPAEAGPVVELIEAMAAPRPRDRPELDEIDKVLKATRKAVRGGEGGGSGGWSLPLRRPVGMPSFVGGGTDPGEPAPAPAGSPVIKGSLAPRTDKPGADPAAGDGATVVMRGTLAEGRREVPGPDAPPRLKGSLAPKGGDAGRGDGGPDPRGGTPPVSPLDDDEGGGAKKA